MRRKAKNDRMPTTTIVQIVKAFHSGNAGVLVLTIPKTVRVSHNFQLGQKFLLKVDKVGRLIYEPVNNGGELKE